MNDQELEKLGHMPVFDELPRIMAQLDIPVHGVIHVGANMGAEVPAYRRMGCDPIVLIEANPAFREHLASIPGVVAHIAAISRDYKEVEFYITEDPQCSSLLRPTDREVVSTIMLPGHPLAEFEESSINILVVDVQGAELNVIQSGVLEAIDVIVCETNTRPTYIGEPTPSQVTRSLFSRGFVRVAHFWHGAASYGDSVFVRPHRVRRGSTLLPGFSDLNRLLQERMFVDTDIAEHLGTLHALASMCSVVVEFGVRTGNSTIALLAGLDRHWGELHSFDIRPHHLPPAVADRENFHFTQADTGELAAIPACDLLFIDTLHTEHHVELELRHAHAVRRWIVLHDTTLFWEGGERGEPGLREAIVRFLDRNPEWKWRHRYMHNNGLLILERSP